MLQPWPLYSFPRLIGGGLVAGLLVLAAGCAVGPPVPATGEEPGIRVEADTLHLRGSIDRELIPDFEAALEANGDLDRVMVESGGGDVETALYFGALIHQAGLDVEVTGYGCLSSCANYIFPAGAARRIQPGAIVAWHGSAIQDDWNHEVTGEARESLDELRRRQELFFELVGVDERITIVGQDLQCECTWALSESDMARFGLSPVKTPDDYENTDLSWARGPGIRFLNLPEDVFDRIRSPR